MRSNLSWPFWAIIIRKESFLSLTRFCSGRHFLRCTLSWTKTLTTSTNWDPVTTVSAAAIEVNRTFRISSSILYISLKLFFLTNDDHRDDHLDHVFTKHANNNSNHDHCNNKSTSNNFFFNLHVFTLKRKITTSLELDWQLSKTFTWYK